MKIVEHALHGLIATFMALGTVVFAAEQQTPKSDAANDAQKPYVPVEGHAFVCVSSHRDRRVRI